MHRCVITNQLTARESIFGTSLTSIPRINRREIVSDVKFQRALALFAFLASAWVVASLALSGDVIPPTTPISTGAFVATLVASGGDIIVTLALILVSVVLYWMIRDRRLLATRLRAPLSRQKGRSPRGPGRNMSQNILGILVLVGVLYALKASGLIQPSKSANSTGPGSFPAFGSLNLPAFPSSIIEIYRFFAVWAFQIVLIAVAGVSILILYQAIQLLRIPAASSGQFNAALANETIIALREGAANLFEGDDYRKSILECYRRLCAIFDGREKNVHHPLTARELQSRMLMKFKLPAKAVSELTHLFEEARYSPHSISTQMRDSAIEALREIESSLRVASEKAVEVIY